MYRIRSAFLVLFVSGLMPGAVSAQSFEAEVTPLVESSCLGCHGPRTATPLNFSELGFDLADHDTFRAWEKVYTRLEKGEMPPAAAPQPDAAVVETALTSLKHALVDANLAARGEQRTPLRRLTRLEYAYTIQDLLGIDEAIASELGQTLPAEADSGGFDTVAVNQSMSSIHVRSYLEAADRALDAALAVGPAPPSDTYVIDYVRSQQLAGIPPRNLGAVRKLDDGFATITPVNSTFLFHSVSEGFFVPYPGRYRVGVEAYPYQVDEPDKPVTLTLYRGIESGSVALLDELVGMIDLVGPSPRTLEVTLFLRPGDLLAPSVADLVYPFDDRPDGYFQPDKNMRDYTGEGIVLKSMTIEGPLFDSDDDVWPPVSTRDLLTGVAFDAAGELRLTKDPYTHVVEIVETFATRAFRRPLHDGELEAYTSLAKPVLAEGRPFLEAVRVPLRAILSAPAFLYQLGDPGALDDYGLASRLSYFLWRSMPDDQLIDLAGEGRLTDPTVLSTQVDRMLDDPKSERFVTDFGGQTFRLYEIKATTPDPFLYPEYDDRLGQAMANETELFLTDLIADNHDVGQLIDADFTYVNRRLAEHYDIPGVEEQHMRRVALPADSPRGGLLTQGSILKLTSNGTTTSPVPRGNFVLANLLGQPAPPPPPGVAGLEPDTRGTTTIREQLEAHRSNPVCGSCHRVIDPPGFALESFDPIGGFRTNYRVSGEMQTFGEFTFPGPYTKGHAVDPSGVTPQGISFGGIQEYKQLLLEQQLDQIARHLTSQLLVFGTGAEIAFADRDTVEQILDQGRTGGHPVRTMIHQVVQSDLFRRR